MRLVLSTSRNAIVRPLVSPPLTNFVDKDQLMNQQRLSHIINPFFEAVGYTVASFTQVMLQTQDWGVCCLGDLPVAMENVTALRMVIR